MSVSMTEPWLRTSRKLNVGFNFIWKASVPVTGSRSASSVRVDPCFLSWAARFNAIVLAPQAPFAGMMLMTRPCCATNSGLRCVSFSITVRNCSLLNGWVRKSFPPRRRACKMRLGLLSRIRLTTGTEGMTATILARACSPSASLVMRSRKHIMPRRPTAPSFPSSGYPCNSMTCADGTSLDTIGNSSEVIFRPGVTKTICHDSFAN